MRLVQRMNKDGRTYNLPSASEVAALVVGDINDGYRNDVMLNLLTSSEGGGRKTKRGLPHAHILLWLHPDDKPKFAEDLDKIISAEIPDEVLDPELYDVVKACMMHGPCGRANLKLPCMKGGKNCTKHFPRGFCSRTTIDEEGFPHYRRKDNGRTVKKKGVELDN
ncbi:hypothetical protein SLEP1_g6876 [Rubroshorea leprosula]|uniref:Helitron helicase-like domain-containing protein n=1 Tax=Rubroshorea leprosula TaxID=152421 RepID=A0AAV5I4W5_9ROSI|nr:hypothetical protein SLEP1_g6876 [Rubroshorea leprosula]